MHWCPSNQDPTYVDSERHLLFPPRLEGRRRLDLSLPPEVEAIYTETYWALCGDSPILAGIGIRAIVEIVCRKKGARKGSLERKIDRLVDLGVLSKNDAKALHRLRDLGNYAAHEVKAPTDESLDIAMNVAEHLLRQIFYLDGVSVRKHLPRKRYPKAKNSGRTAAQTRTQARPTP